MGTLTERINDYFASLSPLASRIVQETNLVKKRYGEEWSNLSIEEQEGILDNHFIDPDIKNTYPQKEDAPECYPKLKINCGENIVADFDDGSMWRDEHSGPFSWYSLSQQDLTIPDPVEFTEEGEDNVTDESPKKGGKGKKKKKKTKKAKAATATDEEICSEDNSLDPLSNEVEMDALKPDQTLNQPENTNGSISLSPSKMSSLKSQVKAEEETKLLDSSFESGADHDNVKAEVKQPVKPKRKKVKVPKAAPPPPPVDKRWKKQDKEMGEIEQTLIRETTTAGPPLKLLQDSEGGMVSSVFLDEVGESSTDPDPKAKPNVSLSDLGTTEGQVSAEPTQEFGAVGGQVNLALDEESASAAKTEQLGDENRKSGFDFLLEW